VNEVDYFLVILITPRNNHSSVASSNRFTGYLVLERFTKNRTDID